jgi:hypothetical protein
MHKAYDQHVQIEVFVVLGHVIGVRSGDYIVEV